ncbi:MAG: 1-acyl-sn-glycerol-3-phosphate acyltransferase [Planctomycetota bacterium]|jgi:1-acyl-sn-glycerol-3-phosphate acyltransferase
MSALRASSRLFALVVVNGLLYPFGLATRIPHWFGKADLSLRMGARIQSIWARSNARLLGLRIEVEHETGAEQGETTDRALVVSNHCSYLDILVLGTLHPGRFVAKSEIASWPLIGLLSRSVGTIFVDQSRPRDVVRVGEEMRRTLDAGVSVVLFPEGRAHRGIEVEPFHTALFSGPARCGIPCLPVAIHYDCPGVPWGSAWTVCWWGGMDLPRHFWRLLGRPGGVSVTVRPAARTIEARDRRSLAESVRASLEGRFRPMTQGPIPPDNPWPELASEDPGAAESA